MLLSIYLISDDIQKLSSCRSEFDEYTETFILIIVGLLKLSMGAMLNHITFMSITSCTIFSLIAAICVPLYSTERVMAQSSPTQGEISIPALQNAVRQQEKTSQQVNDAMRGQFPKSDFPYYDLVDGCSTPWYLSFLPATIINNERFRSACDNHDRCYMTPGRSKFSCDNEMFEDISKICTNYSESCLIAANEYYYGVDKGGQEPYATSQKRQTEYIQSIYAWLNSDITGIWNSSEGTITFQQSRSNVSATYTQDNGVLEGSFSSNTLTGYWIEDGSNRRCNTPRNGRYYWGTIRFVFDGSSFGGAWGYCDDEPTVTWRGNRRNS